MVSSFKPFKEIENLREVTVDIADISSTFLSQTFEDAKSAFKNLFTKSPDLCSDSLEQKQVQDLKKEHFDVVILSMFFCDCYFSLVHHFKVMFF